MSVGEIGPRAPIVVQPPPEELIQALGWLTFYWSSADTQLDLMVDVIDRRRGHGVPFSKLPRPFADKLKLIRKCARSGHLRPLGQECFDLALDGAVLAKRRGDLLRGAFTGRTDEGGVEVLRVWRKDALHEPHLHRVKLRDVRRLSEDVQDFGDFARQLTGRLAVFVDRDVMNSDVDLLLQPQKP
jgi:hypothetical protein